MNFPSGRRKEYQLICCGLFSDVRAQHHEFALHHDGKVKVKQITIAWNEFTFRYVFVRIILMFMWIKGRYFWCVFIGTFRFHSVNKWPLSHLKTFASSFVNFDNESIISVLIPYTFRIGKDAKSVSNRLQLYECHLVVSHMPNIVSTFNA